MLQSNGTTPLNNTIQDMPHGTANWPLLHIDKFSWLLKKQRIFLFEKPNIFHTVSRKFESHTVRNLALSKRQPFTNVDAKLYEYFWQKRFNSWLCNFITSLTLSWFIPTLRILWYRYILQRNRSGFFPKSRMETIAPRQSPNDDKICEAYINKRPG